MSRLLTSVLFLAVLLNLACGKKSSLPDDIDAVAEVVHDTTSSIDESFSGGGLNSFSQLMKPSIRRASLSEKFFDLMIPKAWAAACQITFSTCSSGLRTRTFSSCTLGLSATLEGTVQLTFSDSSCSMATDGNIVTRAPNFTITGRRGASLTVSSTSVTSYDTSATFGVGQKLTRVSSGNFQWETLGMNRSAALPSGREIFDISTKTADGAPLVVTGTSRGNRKIVSGTLEIYHNLAQYKSSVAFDNLQYSPACNEPVSGTVTGTVTGSKSGVFTMTFTDCGTATVSYREGSKDPVTTNSESDTSTAL